MCAEAVDTNAGGAVESYCWSFDEEHYQGEKPTREAALAAAMLEADGRTLVWTGRSDPIALTTVMPDAYYILEHMRDNAADQVGGDIADSWLDFVSKEQQAELEADMHEVIEAWLVKHNELPRFWSVEDVKEHVIPSGVSETAPTAAVSPDSTPTTPIDHQSA